MGISLHISLPSRGFVVFIAMGNVDSIPIISQVKSLGQVIAGDEAGARRTQEVFVRTALVVSQFNSLGHSIAVRAKSLTDLVLTR